MQLFIPNLASYIETLLEACARNAELLLLEADLLLHPNCLQTLKLEKLLDNRGRSKRR